MSRGAEGIQLEISINISSHHLLSDSFFHQLGDALNRYPTVDSKWIQLEILESSVLSDLKTICSIIETCHDTLAINFALDDFGTGYSSLTHLRYLSVDSVKIDQSFVRDLLDDPNDYAITNGVIALSDSFDRGIIAEGVETTEQGLMLQLMGCDNAQGYGIAKPMPVDKFLEWLQHYTPNQDWINNRYKQYTIKEKKLMMFRLTSQRWQKRFMENIYSQPEMIKTWPIKDNKLCHCGYWIKRARQEGLFEEQWLNKFEQSHNDMHTIAEYLFDKYQAGKLDDARKGVAKLKSAFASMLEILECYSCDMAIEE